MSESDDIRLCEVTRKNVGAVMALRVGPSQASFVAENSRSLAEAYVQRDRAWPRAVCRGRDPVGFLMLALIPGDHPDAESRKPEAWLWRFMIAADHQGRGYGRAALKQAIDFVKDRGAYDWLGTSYVPGDGCPEPFYRKLGFEPTGEVEDGEVELRLALT